MTRSVRHRVAAVLSVVAVAVLAVACGSSSPAKTGSNQPAMHVLRYGISGDLSIYWHVFVGQQQGIFTKHDIDLKVVTTPSGSASDLLTLLLAGQVDMADVLPDPVIAASANSSKIKVLNFTGTGVYTLVAKKGITSFADLKKLPKVTAAVSSATTATAGLTKLMLQDAGIPFSHVQLVVTGGTSARLAAVQSGAVDVAVLVQPADFEAQAKGLTVLAHSVSTAPWYGLVDTVLSSSLAKNCSEYKDFFAAMRQIHAFLTNPADKQKAIESLVESGVSSQADAEKTYDLYIQDDAMPGVNNPTTTLQQTDRLLSSLGTKGVADPASLVDTSCVS